MDRLHLHSSLWCSSWLVVACLIAAILGPDLAPAESEATEPFVNESEQPGGSSPRPPDPWTDPRKASVLNALRRRFADPDPGSVSPWLNYSVLQGVS
jgi:hypothetical protein